MAFHLDQDSDLFEVICSKDESVRCSDEQFSEYLKTLDESLLDLDPEVAPSRFVMKKILSYGEGRKIKDSQVGFKDGDMTLRLGYMLDEVRFSLVDIKGDGIKFKKDSDGYAAKSLIEALDSLGIIRELQEARQTALSKKTISKKS